MVETTFKLSYQLSNIFAIVFINVIGGPVNALFYTKGIIGLLKLLKQTAVDICSAILHPVKTLHSIKSSLSSAVRNPVRTIHKVLSKIGRAFLGVCVLINGVAQGSGPAKDKVALSWVHGVTRLPTSVVSKFNFAAMTGGSSGPNYAACVEVTEPWKSVKPDCIEMKDVKPPRSDTVNTIRLSEEGGQCSHSVRSPRDVFRRPKMERSKSYSDFRTAKNRHRLTSGAMGVSDVSNTKKMTRSQSLSNLQMASARNPNRLMSSTAHDSTISSETETETVSNLNH